MELTHDTLYPQLNNDIEYGLFENVIDSYYFDSQIRDDFQCMKTCYTHDTPASTTQPNPTCTHTYDHISQQLDSLADSTKQHILYTNEMDASLFTTQNPNTRRIDQFMVEYPQIMLLCKIFPLTSNTCPWLISIF